MGDDRISNYIVNAGDKPISSFLVTEYDTVIALNHLSLKEFESKVKSGEILIWESSAIETSPNRKDVCGYRIAIYKNAIDILSNVKVMDMIVLGTFIKKNPIVKKDSIIFSLGDSFPPKNINWFL